MRLTIALFALLSWTFPAALAQNSAPVAATEQIVAYNSDITVRPDGTVDVHETIRVFTTGAKRERAIGRDIRTTYHDRFSNPYKIHFKVSWVERDGQPIGFHLDKLPDGLRVVMGSDALPRGEHTFDLSYVVDRATGFFDDHDELYWNVTGNGWQLPIAAVSATLHLPKGIAQEAIMPDAYTGRPGSMESSYTASSDAQSNTTFHSTRALEPGEGFTLVARWPKGFIRPPTDDQKDAFFLQDHQAAINAIVGLVLVMAYYVAMWFRLRQGSDAGQMDLIVEPPHGLSPAGLRFIWRAEFDTKTLVANLLDLALKKQLAILEDGNGAYTLGRVPSATAAAEASAAYLTADERLVLARIFSGGDTLRLEPANHASIAAAMEVLHRQLQTNLEKVYFVATSRYLLPGLLLTLAVAARCAVLVQGGQPILTSVLTFAALLCGLGFLAAIDLAIAAAKYAFSNPQDASAARQQAIVQSGVAAALAIVMVAALTVMSWAASTAVAVVVALAAAAACVFHILVKAQANSALTNEIEAFRTYLVTAEKSPADARAPRHVDASAAERYLPYALALNIEKGWGEKFAASLSLHSKPGGASYSPGWYSGLGWNARTAATFATTLGSSFASAVSSATLPSGSGPALRRPAHRPVRR